MQGKISIIVPVYKVEEELDRCVQSLVNQTYKNIEIILVDDGSPDHCPELCDQYALEDNRIRVLHKKNGGLSDARNAGLERATGEYVLYVDSDDYIDVDACARFMSATDTQDVDIVVGNAIMEKSDGCEMMVHTATPTGTIYGAKEFIIRAISSYQWYAPAWLNMYRREYLLENNLFFKKGIYFEDIQMLPRVFLPAKRIVCMEGTFYHYIIRDNSIMTSKKDEKKKNDSICNLREWKTQFDHVEDIELKKKLYGMLIKMYIHECRLYKICNREIADIDIGFAVRYGLNLKEKIKAVSYLLLPKLFIG